MSFRKIRPSFGESNVSTSTPSQSTSESTGSDPRRPRSDIDTPESSTSSSKRRRVPESVTRNACLNCKKARAKCDGKKPCKRCATRVETAECVYEVHIKHAKEELVKQIKELRAKGHMTEQILQALSTNEKVPEILEKLRNGETYETIVEWLGRSLIGDVDTLSPRESHHSLYEASDHEMTGVAATGNMWTSVTSDRAVLDHLFQLYFAWVHPVHTLFSERRFVESYLSRSESMCSPLLVNAICAMACHLDTTRDGDDVDYVQLGAEFSQAFRTSIDEVDDKLTTVQAFAVMSLVYFARGQGLLATSYLRTATGKLPAATYQEIESFAESWKDTVRGVRNLNIEWAQMTFQVPPNVATAQYDSVEENDEDLDEAMWYFYRYPSDNPKSLPSLLATTNREKSKLNGILQDIATMLYSQRGTAVSPKEFLEQYARLRMWRANLPAAIGNIEANGRALPHVLYLLLLHSTAVVQLLRPLLDLDGFPSSLVEETIWTHAQQGLLLLENYYRPQYAFRYQPVLQMFAVLHLADTIARFFPEGAKAGGSKDGPEAVQFGLEILLESRFGFPVAGPLQEMLRRSANECAILLPRNITELMRSRRPPQNVYRMDDFLNACTRPSYVQPVREVHSKLANGFSSQWKIESPAYGFRESTSGARRLRLPSAEERGAQSLMQIRNLLNTN